MRSAGLAKTRPAPPEDEVSDPGDVSEIHKAGWNALAPWLSVWRLQGKRAWRGSAHPDSILLRREALAVSALIAHTERDGQIWVRPTEFWSAASWQCPREWHRAIAVLALELEDGPSEGILTREKKRENGPDQGRWAVNKFCWRPERLRWIAGKTLKDRPASWPLPPARSDSDCQSLSPTTEHHDRLVAAIEAAGLAVGDFAIHLASAERADKGAFRLARTARYADQRKARYDVRAAEQQQRLEDLRAVLEDLARRPRVVVTAPAPARTVTTIGTVPILSPAELAAQARATIDSPTAPKALTIDELLRARPDDELLPVLARRSTAGDDWAQKAQARVLERGGRITAREQKTLRQMRDEDARPSTQGVRRPGRSTLQKDGTYVPSNVPPGAR